MKTDFNDAFNAWKNSDNVIKTGVDTFRTQCTQYIKAFTLSELKQYFKREYFNN